MQKKKEKKIHAKVTSQLLMGSFQRLEVWQACKEVFS